MRQQEIDFQRPSPLPTPIFQLKGIPNIELVTCCFGWFSVSLASYLRLIALVRLIHENTWTSSDIRQKANRSKIKKACIEYVKQTVPAVYTWRNKIAAHPALTDPFRDDNLGTLEMSVMKPVMYQNSYFRAAALSWGVGDEVSSIEDWALTEEFERLAPRLWPNIKLEPVPTPPPPPPKKS